MCNTENCQPPSRHPTCRSLPQYFLVLVLLPCSFLQYHQPAQYHHSPTAPPPDRTIGGQVGVAHKGKRERKSRPQIGAATFRSHPNRQPMMESYLPLPNMVKALSRWNGLNYQLFVFRLHRDSLSVLPWPAGPMAIAFSFRTRMLSMIGFTIALNFAC